MSDVGVGSTGSMGATSPVSPRACLPRTRAWFHLLGSILLPWIGGYAAWMSYQSLYVRWRDGFQPGFANDVMTPGWWLPTVVVGLGHLWALASIPLDLLPRLFGARISRGGWLRIAVIWSAILALHVPGAWWGAAGVVLFGAGRNAGLELCTAAADGRAEVVRALLWRGVPPDAVPTNDVTALSDAAAAGHLEIVRLLVAEGANVDHQGGTPHSTPLIRATEMNRLEIVRYLVDAGANVELVNGEGRTALDIARAHGYRELAGYIQTKGIPKGGHPSSPAH